MGGHMVEEEQARHIDAARCGRQMRGVQAWQREEVRRNSGEEAEVMKEHGSSRQQRVCVVNPVACTARGAHSRY